MLPIEPLAAACLILGAGMLLAGGLWRMAAARASRLAVQVANLQEKLAELEAELRERERQFRDVMEGAGAAVLFVNSHNEVIECNETAEQLFGLQRHEVQGAALIQAVISSELNDAVAATVRDGQARTVELRDLGPEKRRFEVSIRSMPDGRGAAIFARDVTEVRRLETARKDFVANVSHELRTPLASIRAMAETLQSGARLDDAVAERFLTTIITETDRLARIAEDLLVLSDVESREPDMEHFDLSALLDDIALRFAMRADLEGVTLLADVPRDLTITANRDQLEQAVVNLVDNAIKYTRSGGSVRVSARATDQEIEIAVADTGLGILQEDIPRIFERFYRVDKARSRRSGGTGLGLSIVKHVAESHGGSVRVESAFNHGSTFTLVLPRSADTPPGGGESREDRNFVPGAQ